MDNTNINHDLYDSSESRLDTIIGDGSGEGWLSGRLTDAATLNMVFKAVGREFPNAADRKPANIIKHMSETYGIQLTWNENINSAGMSGWSPTFEIINEVNYTMFLLKYTK